MLNLTCDSPKTSAALLLEIAAALANTTQRAEDFPQVAVLVGRIADGRPVSVAVIHAREKDTRVLLNAHAGSADLPNCDLLGIHQQTLSSDDHPARRWNRTLETREIRLAGLAEHPLATVFADWIDERHRMLLVVHQLQEEAHLPAELMESLRLVGRQLARCLECLVIWLTRPQALGDPFCHLTDREWVVLRQLHSEAGERDVAGQLGMSPHTLHAHIKSIYRKVGVNGRLSMLFRTDNTLRNLRQRKAGSNLAALRSPIEASVSVMATGTSGWAADPAWHRAAENEPQGRIQDFQSATGQGRSVDSQYIA
jgi:DNA-binding CsgD family transcriptional regulator